MFNTAVRPVSPESKPGLASDLPGWISHWPAQQPGNATKNRFATGLQQACAGIQEMQTVVNHAATTKKSASNLDLIGVGIGLTLLLGSV